MSLALDLLFAALPVVLGTVFGFCVFKVCEAREQLDKRNTYTSISGRRRRRESVDGSGFWSGRL